MTSLVRGRPGGPAHHQARLEVDVARRHACVALQPFDDRLNGQLRHSFGVLGDGGEVYVGEAGQSRVVVADDRDVPGHVDASAEQRVEDADGAPVVTGEYSGGPIGPVEQVMRRAYPGVLGVVAFDDIRGQAVAAYGRPVAAATSGGARVSAAVDVPDPVVAQADEQIDRGLSSNLVSRVHAVHAGVGAAPADDRDRQPGAQCPQLCRVGFRADRFDPSLRDLHIRVAAGEIGALEQLVIISRDPAPPDAAYIAASGGLLRDMTIHDFDMARFFLGEVVEVTATGANLISDEIAAAGDIDGAVVVLRGAQGALCTITNSRRCAFGYDQRLEAFGEHGMLYAANQHPTSVRFSGAAHTEAAAPYHHFFLDRYTPAYRAEMDHFVTAVETGSLPSPGFADGRAALALADAANESLRTGTTVKMVGA